MIMRFQLVLLLFLLFSISAYSQTDSSSLKVSLLTCDVGDDAYAAFGHCGIRVIDEKRKKDLVYDYGIFDFDTPNFTWRFMRGNLDYKVADRRMSRFMREYERDERGVIEQQFNLPQQQLIEIYEFLKKNERPENRYYKYNFLHDNCATRLRDIVNGLELGPESPATDLDATYRNYLHGHLPNKPWLKLGIDILLGANTDRVMNYDEQMFLPKHLSDNLSNYVFDNQGKKEKVLGPPVRLIPSKKATSGRLFFHPLFVLIVLLLLLIVLVRWKPKTGKWLFYFFSLVFGLAGCLLIFLWFGTEHTATRMNWNVLWANPLYLLFLLPIQSMKSILTKVSFVLNALVLLFWWLMPQEINFGVLPLVGMFLFLLYSCSRE